LIGIVLEKTAICLAGGDFAEVDLGGRQAGFAWR
jgi:hypothetical protein